MAVGPSARWGGLRASKRRGRTLAPPLPRPVPAAARAVAPGLAGRPGTVHRKSSLMVGPGERRKELSQTFQDLRAVDCDILTIGQYLRPTVAHLPVERYVHPDTFAVFEREAQSLGFRNAAIGPLVRSSYRADRQAHGAGVE